MVPRNGLGEGAGERKPLAIATGPDSPIASDLDAELLARLPVWMAGAVVLALRYLHSLHVSFCFEFADLNVVT